MWLSSASLSVGGTTCNSKAAPDEDVIAPTAKALPANCQSGCAKHCTIKRRLDARRHSSASPMQSHKEAQQGSHHLRQAATRCKTQATATLQSTTRLGLHTHSITAATASAAGTAAAAPQQKPQHRSKSRGSNASAEKERANGATWSNTESTKQSSDIAHRQALA